MSIKFDQSIEMPLKKGCPFNKMDTCLEEYCAIYLGEPHNICAFAKIARNGVSLP